MGIGRRPKTERQREIDGSEDSAKHRAVKQPDPVPGEPEKPAYLGEVASAEWDSLTGILRQEQRLYVSDGKQVESAANLYAAAVRWQQLSDVSPLKTETGRVDECHVQARLAWDTYRKAIVELGLTQTSRSRAATPRKEASGEMSPLARLMARAEIRRVK
jgi:phage terminase small subunit